MCMAAAIWAGIERVVFAASVEQLADVGQNQISVSAQFLAELSFRPVAVEGGLLDREALALFNRGDR